MWSLSGAHSATLVSMKSGLESSHALAHAIRLAPTMSPEKVLIVNLSGRGDKDVDYVAEYLAQ